MADPTVRALRLLELLQSAHQRSVGELVDRLGVDERTVRRDVARLVDLGIGVESVRGRHGGYRLAPGLRALPITFSGDELVALHVALAHAPADTAEPAPALFTALAKIRRCTRPEDARRAEAVLGLIPAGADRARDLPDPAVMLTLAEAVSGRSAVDMRYHDREGNPSRRTVHPYGVEEHGGRWYLMALDTARGEERTFRVDRIASARALPEVFERPRGAGTPLEVRFAGADYRWTVLLRIRATKEHVRAHLPASVARLEPLVGDDDGPAWHRAEIHAERLDWLPPVIAALGSEVVIDGPAELKDLVRAAGARMLRAV